MASLPSPSIPSNPTVTAVTTSGPQITAGAGDLTVNAVVTFTVTMSEAVTVTGGPPTMTLNDGGTATYASGSGSSALVFTYTVLGGQNVGDLAVTTFNLNGATVQDSGNNNANTTGAQINPPGTLVIDTTAPTVTSVTTSGTGITSGAGDLASGAEVTFTVSLSEPALVAGGLPHLTLNDGGTATYVSGSGSSTWLFTYTVGAGQSTADLTVTAVNLFTSQDGAGNIVNGGGAVGNPAGTLQIDGVAPVVTSVTTSGTGITSGTGDLGRHCRGHLYQAST